MSDIADVSSALLRARELGIAGNAHRDAGRFREAEQSYRGGLKIVESILGPDHTVVADHLFGVADVLRRLKRFNEAAPLLERVLGLIERSGPHEFHVAALRCFADVQQERGNIEEASELYRRLVAALEGVHGSTHESVAAGFAEWAKALRDAGRYDKAEPLYLRALALRYQDPVPNHPEIAAVVHELALVYQVQGRSEIAEPLFRQARETILKASAADDVSAVGTLMELAGFYSDTAEYDQSERMLVEARNLLERTPKPKDKDLSMVLGKLALVRRHQGEIESAGQLALEALDVAAPENAAVRAQAHNVLGGVRILQGRFAEAESELEQARNKAEEVFGADHPYIADILTSWADACRYRRRYQAADRHLREAQKIAEKLPVQDNLLLSRILNNLGILRDEQGAYGAAEQYFRRALNITEAVLDPGHPEIAVALTSLAGACARTGRTDEAMELCNRAIGILETFKGTDPEHLASAVNQLGNLYAERGDLAAAEQYYRRAMSLTNTLPLDHPMVGTTKVNVGALILRRNLSAISALDHEPTDEIKQAESLLLEALASMNRTGADEHINYSLLLSYIALGKMLIEGPQSGAKWLVQSAEAAWDNLTANFSVMSRESKVNFAKHIFFSENGDTLYPLAFLSRSVTGETALRWALLSKQLMFEAERQESGALLATLEAAPPEWRDQWRRREDLRKEYRHIAASVLLDQSNPELANTAQERLNEIERSGETLRAANPAFADLARLGNVTVEDVRKALAPHTALLELVEYKVPEGRHYGALVLRCTGEVTPVDLGDAEAVDKEVRRLRTHMDNAVMGLKSGVPAAALENQCRVISSALRALVWEPVRDALAGIDRVYVAPAGLLALVPFEAFAFQSDSETWQYLGEHIEFVYLNTGRDLVRLAKKKLADTAGLPGTALLISDPDFDAEPETLAERVEPSVAPIEQWQESREVFADTLGTASAAPGLYRKWERRPKTQEIDRVAGELLRRANWNVVTWTGADAVKERVLGISPGTNILQISTHGCAVRSSVAGGHDNPLMRSVLLFAGCNNWRPSGKLPGGDGVLTAWEVTGLDLRETRIVNLAACETGVGEVTADGVVGLRQAFLLAGARALTMSMWQVPTESTIRQFVDFYTRWLNSESGEPVPTYKAFREAQLEALRNSRRERGTPHPFYWAGIVYSGDPGDLPA